MKTQIVQKTKYQLGHDISKHVNFKSTRNCTGPLNDENKLQNDEHNKLKKKWKNLENVYCPKLSAVRYKRNASGEINPQ